MITKDAVETAKRVLTIEADAIKALIGKLDGEFGKAVDMICTSAGRVVVCGMGKSGIIGQKIASTLASTGTPAFFLHPAEGVHGDIGMLMKNDVLIAISNSGETEELIKIIPIVKRMGVKMIAMTGRKESALGRHGDVVLDVGVAEEACPMGLTPTTLMYSVKKGDFAQATEYGVANCYECGACAYTCPAKIPLVDYMKFGKSKIPPQPR